MLVDKRKLALGITHILVGILIFGSRFMGGSDLIERLIQLAGTLPEWTLFAAGAVKGVYLVGSLVPGTTYMLLYLLETDCSVNNLSPLILLIWLGVSSGLIASYILGQFTHQLGDRLVHFSGPQKPAKTRNNLMLVFALASHPNLSATYLFECGYWGRRFHLGFLEVCLSGLLLLVFYSGLICSMKALISAETNNIGDVWGLLVVALGIWRIMDAMRVGKS